jgi:siroheme synthase-like protein
MDAFPAFFPLKGAKVVIAGSGDAADAKARLFEGSPATVFRIEGSEALRVGAYTGAILAFIASEDEAFIQAAVAAARAAHVPLNVADHPALCDFTTPSVIDRGEVVAAIGTGGASPMLATMLRTDIEQRMPQGMGRVAALFRELQDEVRLALPALHERRAFLRDALSGQAARAALGGDMDAARRLLRAALAKGSASAGLIQVILAGGPADLLTLRASRALAAADVLIADHDIDPIILSMVRRDAERLAPETADAALMASLAQAGRRVVRVTSSAVAPTDLKALAEALVEVEVLASVP